MSWLDQILGFFGTSRMRLAWKWRRLGQKVERWWHSVQNQGRAYSYAGKTCKDCGHPAAVDATRCTVCEGALVSARRRNLARAYGWLVPAGFPIATAWLCVAIATLFVVTLKVTYDALGSDAGGRYAPIWPILYRYGGMWSPAVFDGKQYWRLVTACFLHADPLHVAMNALGLWVAGQTVEEIFGRARLLFVFLATGVLGFCASAWLKHPYAGVGASGAVFGLIGAVLGHAVRYRGPTAQALRARFVPWLIYGLIFGFFVPNVDNTAHIAGGLAGFALGALLADLRQTRRAPKVVWRIVAVLAIAAVVAAFAGAATQPMDVVETMLREVRG